MAAAAPIAPKYPHAVTAVQFDALYQQVAALFNQGHAALSIQVLKTLIPQVMNLAEGLKNLSGPDQAQLVTALIKQLIAKVPMSADMSALLNAFVDTHLDIIMEAICYAVKHTEDILINFKQKAQQEATAKGCGALCGGKAQS